MNLYNEIAKYCIDHHITRAQFAKELGMSYSALWAKCGGRRKFTLSEAYELAQMIDVSIVDIVKMLA